MNIVELIKDAYPVDWKRFQDADRALNWEYYNGPMPEGYWDDVEHLEHYEWRGYKRAVADIREMLDDLPEELFINTDAEYISEQIPEDEDFSEWARIDPRRLVMHNETWNQCF